MSEVKQSRSSLRLARDLAAAHPARSAVVIALLLAAGLAEGIGVATLLPLVGVIAGESSETSGAARTVEDVLGLVGLEPTIGVLLSLVVAGTTLKAVLVVIARREAGAATADLAMRLRLELIDALMAARWSYFVRQKLGTLSNAVSIEAERGSRVFLGMADLLSSGFQAVVYGALALLLSPQVAVAAIVLGALMAVGLKYFVGLARRQGERQTLLTRSLVTRLQDGLQALKPVKAMGRERALAPLLEQETRELGLAQRRRVTAIAILRQAYEPLTTIFLAAGMYVLLTRLDVPFDALLFMAFLLYRTLGRVGELQGTYQGLVADESAYWSIRDLVSGAVTDREVPLGDKEPSLREGITFDRVSFSYGTTSVLDDVSISLPAGRLTAVLGPSGAGKTTLVDLVCALQRPTSGSIRVDGVPLTEIKLEAWRAAIGYVSQETVMFHDTVARNVSLGEADVSVEDVERALRSAGAWDFVQRMEEGVDTIVGERGSRLSGGQRQRIAIARALVRGIKLLVLDEASAALDPETERELLDVLNGLKGQLTLLAISHQPAVTSIADSVYRLTPGERGSTVSAVTVDASALPSSSNER